MPFYTISYDSNGGSGSIASQIGHSGDTITLSDGSGFTRSGYTLKFWSDSSSGGTIYSLGSNYTVFGNQTFYAVWEASQSYTVSYNSNGGSGSIASQSGTSGTIITLSNGSSFTRTDYTISGWNTNSSGTGTNYSLSASYTITTNQTLYAVWTALPTYTIAYNSNGGSGSIPSQSGTSGTIITLSDGSSFTRAAYKLSGWNTKSDGTGTNYSLSASYTITGNATLYAVWILDIYIIAYNANDGTGTIPDQAGKAGYNIILSSGTGFTRTGYTLSSWNTKSDRTGSDYPLSSIYTVTQNITLYAVWRIIPPNPLASFYSTISSLATGINNSVNSIAVIANLTPVANLNNYELSTAEGVSTYFNIFGNSFQAGMTINSPSVNINVGSSSVDSSGTSVIFSISAVSDISSENTTLTLTNPGGMSQTVNLKLKIKPAPQVTGKYSVTKLFTTEKLQIKGSGFQKGMKLTYTGNGYTIKLTSVNSSGTIATISVIAKMIISSEITFTNPDFGSCSFTLNGPPSRLVLSKVAGDAIHNQTKVVTIGGANIIGKPVVTSDGTNIKTKVKNYKSNSIGVEVNVPNATKSGKYNLTVELTTGEKKSIAYNIK